MMKFRTILQFLAILVMSLAAGGCLLDGEKNQNADSPSIQITSPSASQIDTTDATMDIAGVAFSKSPIDRVHWENDQGGQGMADGAETWQVNNIPLELGVNSVLVTATDVDGAKVSGSIQINRESTGTGSVILSWNAPTARADGSPLTNLSGYRIYYGRMSEIYDFNVRIRNSGVLTYVIENLQPGRWYFVTAAYDSDGVESDFSNEVTTRIL